MAFHVVLISCAMGFGSGVVIDPTTVISANHVFAGDTCTVGGRSITPLYSDGSSDVYVGRVERPFERQTVVNCSPMVEGRRYKLVGARKTTYAVALPIRYDVRVSTGITRNLRGMDGRVEPGMSGGAVLNDRDELVGIISASTVDGNMGVIELAHTPMCGS